MIPPIVVSAIVSGSCLSLLAMGFTLQYLTTRFPNLAYADIAVFSSYLSLTFYLFGLNPYLSLPMSFLCGGILSIFFYKILAVLQKHGIGPIGLMISSLGLDFIVYAFNNIFADYIAYGLKQFAREFQLRVADFALMEIPGIFFVSLGMIVALTVSFQFFLTRTKMGIAMRAIVENHSLAGSQGINVDLVLSVSWFLVGGIAGIAGNLYSMWFSTSPSTGAEMLTRILAAVVVGGLFSIYGSFFGGFLVGAIEGPMILLLILSVGTWVGPYRILVPVAITIITLLLAPRGVTELLARLHEKGQKT